MGPPRPAKPPSKERLKAYHKTALVWSPVLGIEVHRGLPAYEGSYTSGPRALIEYLFHELGHYLATGVTLEELPEDVALHVAMLLDKMSLATSDSMELDASVISYLAGHRLGLWNNPRTILKSCHANTQGWVSMEQLKIEFHQRCQDRSLKEAADRVVSWFKNKVRAQARRRAS